MVSEEFGNSRIFVEVAVLILIVVEYGLGDVSIILMQKNTEVLILIVVEYGLGEYDGRKKEFRGIRS